MEIGAQLYTVRDFCKTPDDFAETLRRVADMGYRTVQVSGTCDYTPQWLKSELEKNGLRCVLTHIAGSRLQDETDSVVRAHDAFGCKYVGLGSFVFDEERDGRHYEDFLRLYRPVIEQLAKGGKYFMYHNHDREFRRLRGKLILELLAEDMPQMGFTLDTFWVQAGGGDPAQWLERLSGRVPCIHLKDYAYGRTMAVLGEGNLNFDRIFEKAESSGAEYLLVEQDDCNGENPFDCLKRSYDYLKSRGF